MVETEENKHLFFVIFLTFSIGTCSTVFVSGVHLSLER